MKWRWEPASTFNPVRVTYGKSRKWDIFIASVDLDLFNQTPNLNGDKLYSKFMCSCHISNTGVLYVGYGRIHHGAQLTHHGIADLSGDSKFALEQS